MNEGMEFPCQNKGGAGGRDAELGSKGRGPGVFGDIMFYLFTLPETFLYQYSDIWPVI